MLGHSSSKIAVFPSAIASSYLIFVERKPEKWREKKARGLKWVSDGEDNRAKERSGERGQEKEAACSNTFPIILPPHYSFPRIYTPSHFEKKENSKFGICGRKRGRDKGIIKEKRKRKVERREGMDM